MGHPEIEQVLFELTGAEPIQGSVALQGKIPNSQYLDVIKTMIWARRVTGHSLLFGEPLSGDTDQAREREFNKTSKRITEQKI